MEKFHSLEEITDKYIGVKGSAERESFDADVEATLIGAAIGSINSAAQLPG